jgi:hypothetical protein
MLLYCVYDHARILDQVKSSLQLTKPGFPYNLLPVSCGDIGLKKNPRSSIGLEIRSQSAFTVFSALLPSANYSAE